MAVKPRKFKKEKRPISEALRIFFETGNREPGNADLFLLAGSKNKLKSAWKAAKDEILSDFIKQHPCQRPHLWWRFDSLGIRRRVGGVGDLWHEIENYKPIECYYGIPRNWVTQTEVDYYNGRSVDINGNPTNEKWPPGSGHYKKGDLKKVAIDENDPPVFESQAAFLQRHDLLTATELKFLKKNPQLLEPETLRFKEDEED
jgi:hypothetical protein